jgi:ABC-type sugar transport system ATPase subunit
MTRIEFSGLAKAYGGQPALRDVSLALEGGEIHALMGENGAGKSTLIRLIAGVTPADSMQVRIDGAPVPLASAADAARAGFRFVHQELHIVPQLSVAENVLLGRPLPRRAGLLVDWPRLRAEAAAALARLGAGGIDPALPAGRLTTGERMLVRLASLLAADDAAPRLYVLDEPTAALTRAESDRLFAVLRELAAAGAAILYVSHRLDEVMALCDRVTVLRDGRVVLAAPVAEAGREGIIRAMTGRAPPAAAAAARRAAAAPVPATSAPVCAVEGVRAGRLRGLSFTLAPGEILGIAGLENAGQSELLRLFLGEGRIAAGRIEVLGGPRPADPAEAWARGVSVVPRERRAEALMPGRSITQNVVLPHLSRLARPLGLARPRAEARMAGAMAGRVRLKFRALGQPVRSLSGGNQQKVVFARALAGAPRLMLLDDPTRGVDVGARAELHRLVRDLARAGAGVILTSTDLPELLDLASRILILAEGRQAALIPAAGMTPGALLAAIYRAGERAA